MDQPGRSKPRRLRIGSVARDLASTLRPLRVLSLTGGGYRGLFSASVLAHLCAHAGHRGPVNTCFDVFGGTSIGGIMACGLAVGIEPSKIVETLDKHGPLVFAPVALKSVRRAISGAVYESARLREAIDDCLGEFAEWPMAQVEAALLVPAVDWLQGTVNLFLSKGFGLGYASEHTLRDVCLATAAAPTYFEPHVLDGNPLLDGGLVLNNPDAALLLEMARRWPTQWSNCLMLSIGTAGGTPQRRASQASKAGLGWAVTMPSFMIEAQERAAAQQACLVLPPGRYVRLNKAPEMRPVASELDEVNEGVRSELLQAAAVVAKDGYRLHGEFVDRLFAR